MDLKGKPRLIIWFVTADNRYISNAVSTLMRQHNGVEILGVTATQKIPVDKPPFISLTELAQNRGGGVRRTSYCWRKEYRHCGSH